MHHEGCNALCDQLVLAVIDYVLEGIAYIVCARKSEMFREGLVSRLCRDRMLLLGS